MKFKEFFLISIKRDHNIFLILIMISFLVFHTSFLNLNYFWDDERFIFSNPDVLQAPHWYTFWNSASTFNKSWPLGYAFFWFIIKYIPNATFVFYKSLNIIFHGVNAFLFFKVLKKLKFTTPFVLALVFLVHPNHVENASWIFQILTIFSFTFFLLSLYSLLNYISENKTIYILCSFVCLLASLWFKAIVVFTPLLYLIIFWIFKVEKQKYLWLILFFGISLYSGFLTLRGVDPNLVPRVQSSFEKHGDFALRAVENGVQALLPQEPPKFTDTEAKSIYDLNWSKKKIKKRYRINQLSVFSQAPWHYFSTTLIPYNVHFVYLRKNYGFFLNSLSLIIIFLLPVFLCFKNKERLFLIMPGLSLVFLLPYLGITIIPFYIWTNVSSRYTYGFISVLAIGLGFILDRYKSKWNLRIVGIYIYFLIFQAVIWGSEFNNPIKLYEDIASKRPAASIYSLLLEKYLIKMDIVNCERVFAKSLELFPEDESVEINRLRLESIREFYKNLK